ncbi:hypothetical protein KFK09_013538 [Dendrobium nobile]|uniref:Phytocyanin domain-containing protein n=1 Tax=Dendrobium nobile TaxID=94219 RepID=A0A8T3B7M8_DENNO|nr:hypothetical protein KFK09_013538 [Dendrobium nobile]
MADMEGRGSRAQAVIAIVLVLLGLQLLHNAKLAESTTYTVGDENGWSNGVLYWPNGKTFYAGDVLEFKYLKNSRNVLELTDYSDYEACTARSYINAYVSGDDYVELRSGNTYFIDGIPGHCSNGAKIAVTAL